MMKLPSKSIACVLLLSWGAGLGCGKSPAPTSPTSPLSPLSPNPVSRTAPLRRGIQEKIWRLNAQGERTEAENLRIRLLQAFQSPQYQEISHPLTGSGRHVLLFENTVEGLFKPDGVPATEAELYHRNAADQRAYDRANSEVAAYRMDTLLQLDLVPMTVPFEFNGIRGSVQYIVRGMSSGVSTETPNAASMKIFDYLIGNDDRHIGNWLYWPQLNRRIGIDHGLAFRSLEGGCFYNGSLYVGQRLSCNPFPHLIAYALLGIGYDNLELNDEYRLNLSSINPELRTRIRNLTPLQLTETLQEWVEPVSLQRIVNRLHLLVSAGI